MHGRSGDSGGKKRSSRLTLAKTTFRQLCLRELGLFRFIMACTRPFLLAGRAALLAPRLEMDRQSSRVDLASGRAIRGISVNRRSCPSSSLQIVANSTSCELLDVSFYYVRNGVLNRTGSSRSWLTPKPDMCCDPERHSRQVDISYLYDPCFLQTEEEVHGACCLGGQTRR